MVNMQDLMGEAVQRNGRAMPNLSWQLEETGAGAQNGTPRGTETGSTSKKDAVAGDEILHIPSRILVKPAVPEEDKKGWRKARHCEKQRQTFSF